MTNSNENLSQIVMSLARSARAITDDHEERIQTLEDIVARLTRIEEAQNRMLASMNKDRLLEQ